MKEPEARELMRSSMYIGRTQSRMQREQTGGAPQEYSSETHCTRSPDPAMEKVFHPLGQQGQPYMIPGG